MLASITPLGERARGRRWGITVSWYIAASTAGGATLGVLAGAAGQSIAVVAASGRAAALGLVAALAAMALVFDAGIVGLPVPSVHRQVNENWLNRYRGWAYGAGFGAQLGFGVVTVVSTAWYAALVDRRSGSVAAKAYTRLRPILTAAVDDDRIGKNPCRIDRGGVERHPEQRFATMAELGQLAAVVPDRYRALVLTAGLAGLREGELFALRWNDVDLADGVITVRRKRLRLASGEVIEDDPKSRAGRRKVAMPATLVAELKRHLAEHGHVATPDSYVFLSPTGEPIERSNFRHRVWLPATQTAGLAGLRFHDLRHTAGTLAARTGATTKELMARLGHSSARASMIYQHAAEDRDRRIAEGLDEMAREAGVSQPDRPGPTGTAIS